MADGGALTADRMSGALVMGTARAGLTLASVYPQLIKTSWAMWGNLNDAEKQSGPIGGQTIKRVAGRLAKSLVTKPIPIATAIHILKQRRVERILRESRAAAEAKRVRESAAAGEANRVE